MKSNLVVEKPRFRYGNAMKKLKAKGGAAPAAVGAHEQLGGRRHGAVAAAPGATLGGGSQGACRRTPHAKKTAAERL